MYEQGFEPRGTEISQRLVTWNNMVKNTGYMATLSNLPFRYAEQLARRFAYVYKLTDAMQVSHLNYVPGELKMGEEVTEKNLF